MCCFFSGTLQGSDQKSRGYDTLLVRMDFLLYIYSFGNEYTLFYVVTYYNCEDIKVSSSKVRVEIEAAD